jgi:signal transduction histidine kinase
LPLKDDNGHVVFLLPEGRDITKEKACEREIAEKESEIRALMQRLKELWEVRSELFGNISRELRVAKTVAGESEPSDADLKWAQIVIERQIEQMRRILDGLLDVSRLTRGKSRLRKERLSLRESLVSAIESVRPMIAARGHKLTVDIPAEMIAIEADPVRLGQVFAHLLRNAVLYTDDGGKIAVRVRIMGTNVVVSILDSGQGIAREHLPHVFNMFSQAASAAERPEGGLGIGLALTRTLVLLHGGSIEAHSAGPGQGSEFVVVLPLAAH